MPRTALASPSPPPGAPSAPPPTFVAATIRLYGTRILVVIVPRSTLTSPDESRLVIDAFARRSGCVIVLVACDRNCVPTYFGPEPIARALAAIPFDALSWRIYRKRPPPARLPIPLEPEPEPESEIDEPTGCSAARPPPAVATRVIRK